MIFLVSVGWWWVSEPAYWQFHCRFIRSIKVQFNPSLPTFFAKNSLVLSERSNLRGAWQTKQGIWHLKPLKNGNWECQIHRNRSTRNLGMQSSNNMGSELSPINPQESCEQTSAFYRQPLQSPKHLLCSQYLWMEHIRMSPTRGANVNTKKAMTSGQIEPSPNAHKQVLWITDTKGRPPRPQFSDRKLFQHLSSIAHGIWRVDQLGVTLHRKPAPDLGC